MSISSTRPVASPEAIQSQEGEVSLAKKNVSSSSVEETIPTTTEETQVNLSEAQAQLMQPGADDIDLEKVESLKQAIQAGELQIDVGKIADRLISLSQDLNEG